MFRGTTPTLNIRFKENLEDLDISAFYISFKQNNEIKLEKELSDININVNIVSLTLTQEETLLFTANDIIQIQCRYKIGEKAYATKIIKTVFEPTLKEGVI